MLITGKGDGEALNNRLRVKLSTARRSLKDQGILSYQHFGMESTVIPWTLEDGTERDALHLVKVTHHRHVFADILATSNLLDIVKKK